ncbi:MAG: ribonuclease P protein component [Duodenibacillus sp.]|nr:ribonuclease P protein component [Duodenibacillus sp.]
MTATAIRPGHPHAFPKAARLLDSGCFGELLKATGPGVIRLGRGCLSACARADAGAPGVRFGFTVGKRNVPRSVDRTLVKRVLRESSREMRPRLEEAFARQGVGLDVVLRVRAPIREVGRAASVADTKAMVRSSARQCLAAVQAKLAGKPRGKACSQGS